jgi:hypothetical protein
MSDLTLQANAIFESVSYDENADSWIFQFADKISVQVSGFWRALENNKIVLVSLDHGHQFGLPNPINLVEEITSLLGGDILMELSVDADTADLTLLLTNNHKLEILIASAGYETYQFSIQNKRYIGLGSGEIASFDDK